MKKLNTLDKVLLGIAVFLFVFIVATVVIYTMNGWQYDTLITCVMGGGGAADNKTFEISNVTASGFTVTNKYSAWNSYGFQVFYYCWY